MAKVEITGFSGSERFSALNIGQYFLYNNCLYVKIDTDQHFNTFDFDDDDTTTFDLDDLVTPIASREITIKVERGRK